MKHVLMTLSVITIFFPTWSARADEAVFVSGAKPKMLLETGAGVELRAKS